MPQATHGLGRRESRAPRSPFTRRDHAAFADPSRRHERTLAWTSSPFPSRRPPRRRLRRLTRLSDLLTPLAGASAAALAVMLVTLLVRALLIPVGISQAKAEQTRARLAPKLRELQRRHKKNPERLQKETMALYRAENTSPFAGMLPVLAQAPSSASCTRCSCARRSRDTRTSCSRTTCSAHLWARV